MSLSKIRTLAQVLPSLIAPYMRAHGRCVAATRVGILALAELGIKADALAVDVQLFNAAAASWVLEGQPGGYEEFVRRGCYYLTTLRTPGAAVRPPTRVNVGPVWDGHVVVHVPAEQVLVDFDARQLARPEFGLHVPASIIAPWDGTRAELEADDGSRLIYYPRLDAFGQPDRAFERAPDWTKFMDDVVQLVARHAR